MAEQSTIAKIKTSVRISHSKLDSDVAGCIDACKADLTVCGIKADDETDALIYSAIKLYCKAELTDDTGKAEHFRVNYDALKACLMMAEGYGWQEGDGSDE